MPTISSVIKIVDEFSKPLKDLTDASKNAANSVADIVDKLIKEAEALKDIKDDQEKYKQSLRQFSAEYFNFSKIATSASGIIGQTVGAMSGLFSSINEQIEQTIDTLTTTNKLEAFWGKAGTSAKQYAKTLATELGQSQKVVTDLAAKAAFGGIGTDDFERAMRLADKIGKLKPGETTEGAASTILDNIKSGHDAGTIARLLGGGQMMERRLQRSGYERALRRGDVAKALEIAEKIAEQAGLTDEKYKKATNGLAENYQKINNTIEDIKEQLRETFVKYFEPIVKKIADLVSSNSFQRTVGAITAAVKRLGEITSGVAGFVIDHLHDIIVLLGSGFLVAKIGMVFVAVKKFGGLIVIFKQLATAVHAVGLAMKLAFLANPVTIVIGAVVGLGVAIGKATGKIASLGGALMALAKMAQNLFHDIGLIVDALVNDDPTEAFKKHNEDIRKTINDNLDKIRSLNEEMNSIVDLANSGSISIDDAMESINKMKAEREKLEKINEDLRKQQDQNFKEWRTTVEGLQFKGMEGVAEAAQMSNEAFVEKVTGAVSDLLNQKEKAEAARMGIFMKFAQQSVWLSKYIAQKNEKIATNSDQIRESLTQEEELSWMKAFSDRQIMSSYSSMTSNIRNVTINGVSEAGVTEFGRRSVSAMPPRARSTR